MNTVVALVLQNRMPPRLSPASALNTLPDPLHPAGEVECRSMDMLDLIASRTSVRSYTGQCVPRELLDKVQKAGELAQTLTPVPMRFHLVVDGPVLEGDLKGVLGDYGKVIRAPHYIVITAHEHPGYLVDAGYRFEQLVLGATALGMGTCWIGGFFNETTVQRALGLTELDRVVSLTPVGYPARQMGLLQRAVRVAIRSDNRLPVDTVFSWERAGQPLPVKVLGNTRCMRLLEAARRAPSWANKQPWRFVLTSSEVWLYKQARQVKEGKDYHLVDCGIVMAHVHLGAQALGLKGRWRLDSASVPGEPGTPAIGRYIFDAPWLGE